MNKQLTLLACGALLQACAAGGTNDDGSFQRGVAPTAATADGRHVGFVLAHGLSGSVDSFDPAIVAALQADGYYVLRDAVPPIDSVEHRATALAEQVDSFIAANQLDRVHVIAHSMGGLDTRFLISTLGYGDKITSLTTLGTPHRGSPLADIALGLTSDLSTSQEDALLQFTNIFGGDVDATQIDLALTDLAEANAPAFNDANPDADGVTYRSYAGYSTLFGVPNINAFWACRASGARTPSPSSLPGVLQLAGPIIGGLSFRPHDGVVPIDSAKWTGFAGCIPTDHLDMTRAGEKAASDLDLDLVSFYRGLAANVGSL